MSIIKPNRLELGQTIGVVAPSSPPRAVTEIDPWLERIRALGFRVKAGPHVYDRHGYLAGRDIDRASDINAMFADPAVDAIICLRSGYGSARTLRYLDFEMIRQHPKIIIGYSDLTALLNAIHLRTGLITFHGPEAEDQIIQQPYSLAEFQKVLMVGQPNSVIGALPMGQPSLEPIQTYVSGKARGRLVGGNLNTIVALLGTLYEPDFRDALLFLETYGQDAYALGSMLHHLWLAGKLQQVTGVVFGQLQDCADAAFTKHEVLAEHVINLGIPAMYGLMIGHMEEQTTVPIGCEAELDADAGTLTLLESAVI